MPMREAPLDPWRRCDLNRLTTAERAIYDAMIAVEALPGDARLTNAVTQLAAARAHVADFVDGVERMPETYRKPI